MTTPTPLRELPAKWRSEACDMRYTTNEPGPHDGARAEELEACADELEAALSARDEAGAVCPQCKGDGLDGEPGDGIVSDVTWTCETCNGRGKVATPPAASGDAQSPSYDALLIIAQSVCGALKRAGFDDCDDPGEAIDVMREGYERRLAAVAPEGMDEVVAYFAESDREAYVFHANDGESLDAYTADGFTVTPLVRSTRAQPDSVMPAEAVQQQASLYAAPTPPATAGKE